MRGKTVAQGMRRDAVWQIKIAAQATQAALSNAGIKNLAPVCQQKPALAKLWRKV